MPEEKFGNSTNAWGRQRPSPCIRVYQAPRTRALAGAEKGQALTEYVLLLSVAVALSMALMIGFQQTMHKGIQAFNVTLETDLETCNLQNEEIWTN